MQNCDDHSICQKEALHNATMLCKERNLRFTALRKTIFMLIWESHRPIKAYDLIKQMSSQDKIVQPPIVYRTLDFLLEHRLIHKLNSINSYTGCSHPFKNHSCSFLICTNCKDVKEFCNDTFNLHLQHVIEDSNFHNRDNIIEILGECAKCRK